MKHKPHRLHRLTQSDLSISSTGMPDTELLARFAANRDEVAFELLVRRHAPMVLAVCRRLLSDTNDADDAFQATFLVLARKAGTVAEADVLGAWLHRVAFRVALRVRDDRNRRTNREVGGVDELPSRPQADLGWTELHRVLDEEVVQLPARHRAVFVLCCLEGKTGEEVSRLLGCPPGTVSSRLTRARERLRERLIRRGFTPALLVTSALSTSELVAAPSAALLDSTLRAIPTFIAGWYQGGFSARPATIAEGVMRAMFMNKLRLVSLLFALGLIAAGGVLAVSHGAADDPGQSQPKENISNGEKVVANHPTVRLIHPQLSGRDRIIVQGATVEASRQAELHPRIAGVLKNVMVDVGDRVKEGELLAQIDAPALALDEQLARIAVMQAQSLVQEAEASLLINKSEVAAAAGVVKLRESELPGVLAKLETYKRDVELNDNAGKTIDLRTVIEGQRQYRQAKAQADAASVSVDNARLDLEIKHSKTRMCEAAIMSAKANVDAARVGLEKARVAANQTKIVAPFDGVVTQRLCQPGYFVDPATHTVLFTLIQMDTVRLSVHIPSEYRQTARVGFPVELNFPALQSGGRVTGKLTRVGVVIEPPQETVRGEIDVPNPKGDILQGMFAAATFKFGETLTLPAEAVFSQSVGSRVLHQVYVYRDGKARLTNVKIERRAEKEIEVLAGLNPDDKVVANPKKLVGNEVEVEVEGPAPK